MYIVLYLTILVNVIIITKILYGTIMKPNVLFSSLWCFAAGTSSLGLYDIYKTIDQVHFYAISLVIIFNLTYFLWNKVKLRNKPFLLKGEINYKYLYIFNLIAWLYSFDFLLTSLNIIFNEGGLKVLRLYAFNSEMGFATTSELLIFQIFINAIFSATTIIFVISIITKNYNYKLTLITIIDISIYTILFGGRELLFNLVLYYIAAFIILKSLNYAGKKIKLNKKVIIIMVVVLSIVTVSRSWGETDFFESFVQYFSSGFNHLSVILEDGHKENYLWGSATFGFLVNFILMTISLLLNIDYSGSDYLINKVTSIPRSISPSLKTNANTTIIYPFLRDLGYIGIFIGAAFLSGLTSFFETKSLNSRSMRLFCIYIFIVSVLLRSTFTYKLLFPGSFMTIIFIILFLKKAIEINESKEEVFK